LLELMIAICVLTVGITGILGLIPTLSSARTMSLEMATVRQIASSIAERIQSSAWTDLGGQGTGNEWSKPRYQDTTTPVNPPLTDLAALPANDLIQTGILAQLSGVADLKVYLEYYNGNFMSSATDRTTWYAQIQGAAGVANRYTTFATPDNSTPPVVVRILLTWRESAGIPSMSHELFIARRP
jgi:hypothetical protein